MTPGKLKALRELKGLSQEEIAAVVCRTSNTIAQWESGRRNIDPGLWKLLLLTYNVRNEDLAEPVIESPESRVCAKDTTQPKTFSSELMPILQFKKRLLELQQSTHNQEISLCAPGDLKFIDLFAGIGGIRSAFEQNGAKCVFSSEIDIHAQYTYYANYGTVPYGDITKIAAEDIPDHDILCAGFPCQPFSHIGKREGFKHPTQGTMFHEIVRILMVRKPKAIFLENVPGILNHDEGRTLQVILDSLKELGYNCQYTVLNAKNFGVPQSRARFYLVGFLQDVDFSFPVPPNETADLGDILEEGVTGYEISDHLQKTYLFKKDDGRPILVDKNTKGPMKTLVCSYHKIQRLTGTFVKDGPTGIRLLTQNECKAVMGFPKDFKIPVSRTQMYRQMGNSVVVKVVAAIAEQVVKSLRSQKS